MPKAEIRKNGLWGNTVHTRGRKGSGNMERGKKKGHGVHYGGRWDGGSDVRCRPGRALRWRGEEYEYFRTQTTP